MFIFRPICIADDGTHLVTMTPHVSAERRQENTLAFLTHSHEWCRQSDAEELRIGRKEVCLHVLPVLIVEHCLSSCLSVLRRIEQNTMNWRDYKQQKLISEVVEARMWRSQCLWMWSWLSTPSFLAVILSLHRHGWEKQGNFMSIFKGALISFIMVLIL